MIKVGFSLRVSHKTSIGFISIKLGINSSLRIEEESDTNISLGISRRRLVRNANLKSS